jgi:hypothetical protein
VNVVVVVDAGDAQSPAATAVPSNRVSSLQSYTLERYPVVFLTPVLFYPPYPTLSFSLPLLVCSACSVCVCVWACVQHLKSNHTTPSTLHPSCQGSDLTHTNYTLIKKTLLMRTVLPEHPVSPTNLHNHQTSCWGALARHT